MDAIRSARFLPVFYGLSACSWVPHWSCHYYRLETKSTFVVGAWSFSFAESAVSLIAYSLLISLSLLSISFGAFRIIAAGLSGLCHLFIGALHVYRLLRPFTFEVFGYPWPSGASLREAMVVVPFGLLSLFVAMAIKRAEIRASRI